MVDLYISWSQATQNGACNINLFKTPLFCTSIVFLLYMQPVLAVGVHFRVSVNFWTFQQREQKCRGCWAVTALAHSSTSHTNRLALTFKVLDGDYHTPLYGFVIFVKKIGCFFIHCHAFMHFLTPGMCSQKCTIRLLFHCADIIEYQ